MRLQKYLSRCGLGSRRFCESLIEAGRVSVNDQVVRQQGTEVDPESDRVRVDGKPVQMSRERRVLMLHKPAGYVTTRSDPYGKQTVYDLLPESLRSEVFPVGRLDKNTEGLLLFTNDGELAYRLTHPKFGVDKTYQVRLRGERPREKLAVLEEGIELSSGPTHPAKITQYRAGSQMTTFSLTLHEGKKRQIRRMCKAAGLPLIALKRYRQGPIHLGRLERGRWRDLSRAELEQLERTLSIQKKGE